MTFYQLLNSYTYLDCSVCIGDVDMPADICWDEEARVSQLGYQKFRDLMDCEAFYDEESNLLDIPDGNPEEGERFVYALAGYVGDKCYRTWFSEYGKPAACECSHCDRKNCPHREAYRRFLKEDGGLELCSLLFDEV